MAASAAAITRKRAADAPASIDIPTPYTIVNSPPSSMPLDSTACRSERTSEMAMTAVAPATSIMAVFSAQASSSGGVPSYSRHTGRG